MKKLVKKNHQSMEKKEDALQLKVDVLHSQNEKKKNEKDIADLKRPSMLDNLMPYNIPKPTDQATEKDVATKIIHKLLVETLRMPTFT